MRVWRYYPPSNPQGVGGDKPDGKWKCVCTIAGHHGGVVYGVSWSKSGLLATACADNALRVFAEQPGSDPHAPAFTLAAMVEQAHSEDINSVEWSPADDGSLLTAGDDGLVKIWTFTSA